MLHSIQTQYSHSTCSYMTCGCNLAHGMPSSDHFTLEHYIQLKVFLLDLTLIGAVMSTVIQDDWVRDGCHKNPKRRKQNTTALHMRHSHKIFDLTHFEELCRGNCYFVTWHDSWAQEG